MSGKGVTLYTAGTTNGWKASILLEELQLPYKVRLIDLSANEQKEEWYLKINPNGRIPAIGNALHAADASRACILVLIVAFLQVSLAIFPICVLLLFSPTVHTMRISSPVRDCLPEYRTNSHVTVTSFVCS